MVDAEPERTVAAWVHEYAARSANPDQVDAFVTKVDDAILAAIPEIARDPALVLDLHASTRSQFQIFLSLLERPAQELLLPPQAVDLALSIARRQLELGVLLQVYRVASSAVWDYFTEVVAGVEDDGPDRTAVLVYLWGHGGAWINGAIEQLIGVFYAEREATLHGALARRSETVHAVLRGDRVTESEAVTALGHPVRECHTAVVLWAGHAAGSPDLLGALTSAVGAVGAATGAHVLSIPGGRGELWAWLTSRSPVEEAAVRSAVHEVGARCQVAVGRPVAGVVGMRESHQEAVAAQRHALAVGSQEVCTTYADVELPALLAGNEPAARRFVERELAGLADPDPALDRVRETVAAFLGRGASVEQAAADLFVHKNTVRYRIGQAEELLGHPLTERRTEVALALACRERYQQR